MIFDSILIHKIFETQADKFPNKAALILENEEISYKELNEKTNKLAHFLRYEYQRKYGHEMCSDTLIAISLNRGFELIIGILAIIKAGAAYVPIDPIYPPERINFILTDAKPKFLLTSKEIYNKINSYEENIIFIDDENKDYLNCNASNLDLDINTNNLAYVIYTSGTTGTPKGVAVEHNGIYELLASVSKILNIETNSRILQYTSCCFDSMVLEWSLSFFTAGTLILVKDKENLLGIGLLETISKYSITDIILTPSALTNLPELKNLSLKNIILGGEKVTDSLYNNVIKKLQGNIKVFNFYGPTEATITSSIFEISDKYSPSVIGKEVGGKKIYILDENLELCENGKVGEIYIGGEGLARCYLNNPDLTNEKFIMNPFTSMDEKLSGKNLRIYRSGDWAYYLEDGIIDYVGRKDQQVKVRGFRIECGEVENAILTHPSIYQVIVSVYKNNSENFLIAYYILKNNLKNNQNFKIELNQYLQEKLPYFMIPSFFFPIEAIPLNSNGKLDVNALPKPDFQSSNLLHSELMTETEEIVAKMCSELIFGGKVGINEDLHYLGFNSLKLSQLQVRINEVFKENISLSKIYYLKTIKKISLLIEKEKNCLDKNENNFIIIKKLKKLYDNVYPLTFQQQQIWWFEKLIPESLVYQSQYSLRIKGKLNCLILEKALTEIVKRQEVFRTSFCFDEKNNEPKQIIHEPWQVKMPVEDLSVLKINSSETEIKKILLQHFKEKINPEFSPCVRWKLYFLGNDEWIFTHMEHHLIHDGWSINIFLNELKILYELFNLNSKATLPILNIEYTDYSLWQKEEKNKEEANKQLDYWVNKLKDIEEYCYLFENKLDSNFFDYKGKCIQLVLGREIKKQLLNLKNNYSISEFVVLYSLFFVLLSSYSQKRSFVVATAVGNRNLKEFESICGMFVNVLPIFLNINYNHSFIDLMKEIEFSLAEGLENSEVPFQEIVKKLNYSGNFERNPIFQNSFSFHNSQIPNLNFCGLECKFHVENNNTAKFDLNVIGIPLEEETTLFWEYSENIFTELEIKNMQNHFKNLLNSVFSNPNAKICDLKMLSDNEFNEVVYQWNKLREEENCSKLIHHLFEEKSEKNANNIALVCSNNSISYNELNKQVNKLANYIRNKFYVYYSYEFPVGTYVAIAVERSIDYIICSLAILKTGGTFIQLDLQNPRSRLNFILEDVNPQILLTNTDDDFQNFKFLSINIEKEYLNIQQQCGENLQVNITKNDLAYIMYTSGTTGKPKGTLIEHEGIVSLANSVTKICKLNQNSRLLQCSSASFDAMIFEWVSALTSEGTLVIPQNKEYLIGEDLFNILVDNNITDLVITPSIFFSLNNLEELPLKNLILVGEKLTDNLLKKCHSVLQSKTNIFNAYGPTEATICSTIYRYDNLLPASVIGKAIANKKIYILDQNLNPCPIGVKGEICIGGDGIGRGYLNRTELTAEKFIANPFVSSDDLADGKNLRLYRSGDIGVFLEDGNINFIGRNDKQVKMRGVRIELEEIENVLLKYPGISQAVVSVFENQLGKYLVCYFIVENKIQENIINKLEEN